LEYKEIQIGLQISEQDYRDLPYPSYSLLSDIKKNGVEVIDGVRNTDIGDLDGVMFGKLVDNLLTENKLPDNLYIVDKKPSGKAKEILKALVKNISKMPNKRSLFHKDNLDIINNVCKRLKYHKAGKKDNFDDTSESLKNKRISGLKNYSKYCKVLMSSKNIDDDFIVTSYLYNEALKVVQVLKTEYPFLTDGTVQIIPQVKLCHHVSGVMTKGMLDFVIIDHKNKTITAWDLKTGSYNAEDFVEKGYIGWNYYLQSSLYLELLWNELKLHTKLRGYTLCNFHFMYCGRFEKKPALFDIPPGAIKDGRNGFILKITNESGIEESINQEGVSELLKMYSEHKAKIK
jgi:hypothetical protein